jgi:hypothetical protein
MAADKDGLNRFTKLYYYDAIESELSQYGHGIDAVFLNNDFSVIN